MTPPAPTVLERRVAAAQATLDRYLNKPFVWGVTDCARVAAFNLRKLGGRAPLARFGAYSSALGAARALKRQGFADLGEVMDSLGYPRIPPAAALPGDIVSLQGLEQPVALMVALGNGRVLGWLEGHNGARVLQPVAYHAAWLAI